MSTSGDVQYIGGIPKVHRGDIMSSTSGDIMIHVGYTTSTSGDTMSTSGGHHEYIGGYHEYIGGCSIHRGFQ